MVEFRHHSSTRAKAQKLPWDSLIAAHAARLRIVAVDCGSLRFVAVDCGSLRFNGIGTGFFRAIATKELKEHERRIKLGAERLTWAQLGLASAHLESGWAQVGLTWAHFGLTWKALGLKGGLT
jgi:hypothetical protein